MGGICRPSRQSSRYRLLLLPTIFARYVVKAEHRTPILAELIGTGMLLATVVGSGIMGERLAQGNSAIALLANSVATGAILVVLILTFGPLSGAHFNPVVT